MIDLNFPKYTFKIQQKEKNFYIYCPRRKKYVLLTPEEWVRQHTLQFLINEKSYSLSSIFIESTFKLYGLKKRLDILVYKNKKPHLIVECKSPSVLICQKTMDQISRYSLILENTYLMITNGLDHFYFYIENNNKKIILLKDLPL